MVTISRPGNAGGKAGNSSPLARKTARRTASNRYFIATAWSRKAWENSKNHANGRTQPGEAPSRPRWKRQHDEFGHKNLDPQKWNVLLREHSKHPELQCYVPDEVYVENGGLRLRGGRDYGSKHYTSGRLDTKDKFAPVYGRFETRGRLPGGQGLWPACWLYPPNRDWRMEQLMAEAVANGREHLIPEDRPWYSEIDIMEFLGREPNVCCGTLHYFTCQGQKRTSSATWQAGCDLSKAFHVHALEWEPDVMRWFVDGQVMHSTTNGIPHTPHCFICRARVAAKLTQERLAELAGLNARTVQKIGVGDINIPVTTLARIQAAIGCSRSALLGPDAKRCRL